MPWTVTAPSFVDLELFMAVLDTGSLTRAAAVQGISQPAASARLRSLERRLGVQLLERTTSGSTTTAAGLAVSEWASDVLAAMERLLSGVGALQADHAQQLRVIASYTTAEHLLPQWLSAFHRAHPDVGTELRVANSSAVEREVRDGRADLGFVEGPQHITDLHALEVARDELIVVVAPDHPWARRRAPLTIRALAATPLVVRETGSGTRETLDLVVGRHGAQAVAPALELGSTVAVKSAVIAGVGPAVISRLAVEGDLATGRLVAVGLEGVAIDRTLRAVWSRDRVPSAAALALLQQLGLPAPGRGRRPVSRGAVR